MQAILGVLDHEIRTPLTVVAGYARMLLDGDAGPLNETQRDFLGEVKRAARRVEILLDHLTEVGAGGDPTAIPVLRCPSSLHEIVRSSLEAVRPMAQEKGVRITVELDPDADPLEADPFRLEQVVTNLLMNAMKFTPEGSTVWVETGLADDEKGDLCWLTVRDEGPGIVPEEARTIFEPFVRGRAAREGAVQGVGLGLTICRRIVEAHGGSIEAVPARGGGVLRVTLPIGA